METYKYKESIKFHNPIRIIAIAISILMMIFIQFPSGIFLLILTGISYFISPGFEINTKKNRYHTALCIFGWYIGIWKKLPPIEYVTVVGIRITGIVIIPPFIEKGMNVKEFNINLIVDHPIRYINIISLDKKDALKVALEIGESLDLKVLDFTTPNEKWIR